MGKGVVFKGVSSWRLAFINNFSTAGQRAASKWVCEGGCHHPTTPPPLKINSGFSLPAQPMRPNLTFPV